MHTCINTCIHMCMYMYIEIYTYTHDAFGVNSPYTLCYYCNKDILSSPVLGCPSSLHTTRASTLLH